MVRIDAFCFQPEVLHQIGDTRFAAARQPPRLAGSGGVDGGSSDAGRSRGLICQATHRRGQLAHLRYDGRQLVGQPGILSLQFDLAISLAFEDRLDLRSGKSDHHVDETVNIMV
jgi:hypothetical protein